MSYYTINAQLNGIEVIFDAKPVETVRKTLKEAGFRWHKTKHLWYARLTDERKEVAKKVTEVPENTVDFSDWSGTITDGYMGAPCWNGSKCHNHLYGSDLSKAIREDLKAHGIKGVTVKCGRGGWTDSITATINVTMSDFVNYEGLTNIVGYYFDTLSINQYHIEMYEAYLSADLVRKISLVNACLRAYKYDDSNAMVDYFNTNMYYNIYIKIKGGKK